MPIKIFGEIEEKAVQMANDGYNANRIAKAIGVSEGTVSSWAKNKQISLQKRVSPETIAKESRFIELLKSGLILKSICKELNLDHRAALKIAEKYNLSGLLENRAKLAKENRRLSMTEANSILPEGHGTVTHFDSLSKEYIIKRDDGTTYVRITSQLFRGDPNLSSHRRCTE